MTVKRAPRGGAYEPVAAQLAELAKLEALSRDRVLTPAEAARLELLIGRDEQRARYRPARIAKLRAELELLEAQEREAGQRALRVQLRLPLMMIVREAA